AISDLPPAETLCFEPANRHPHRFGALRRAVPRTGVVQNAAVRNRLGHRLGIGFLTFRRPVARPNRKREGASELEVSLVMRRNAADGSSAVVWQYEICQPDRNGLAVGGVCRLKAGIEALLQPPLRLALKTGLTADTFHEPLHLRSSRRLAGEDGDRRVLRGQGQERRSKKSVRPRGEHRQRLWQTFHTKEDLGAFG